MATRPTERPLTSSRRVAIAPVAGRAVAHARGTARTLVSPRGAARFDGGRCLVGLALLALVVSCLGVAARLDGPTVARWDLADAGVLMSCADEPSSRNEPLWCESPDSPHCTRGTPAPESREPWLGPLFAAHVDGLIVPTYDQLPVRSTRLGETALLGHAWTHGERLERPPRRS